MAACRAGVSGEPFFRPTAVTSLLPTLTRPRMVKESGCCFWAHAERGGVVEDAVDPLGVQLGQGLLDVGQRHGVDGRLSLGGAGLLAQGREALELAGGALGDGDVLPAQGLDGEVQRVPAAAATELPALK